MRLRSVATVLGVSIALGGALVRCTVPELPAPPNAFSTRVKSARGMVVSLPAETIDRPALIASLKDIGATTIILTRAQTGRGRPPRIALLSPSSCNVKSGFRTRRS